MRYRTPRQYAYATCKTCGWTGPYIPIVGATQTDPSYLDGDHPDECDECGGEEFEYDSEYLYPGDFQDCEPRDD